MKKHCFAKTTVYTILGSIICICTGYGNNSVHLSQILEREGAFHDECDPATPDDEVCPAQRRKIALIFTLAFPALYFGEFLGGVLTTYLGARKLAVISILALMMGNGLFASSPKSNFVLLAASQTIILATGCMAFISTLALTKAVPSSRKIATLFGCLFNFSYILMAIFNITNKETSLSRSALFLIYLVPLTICLLLTITLFPSTNTLQAMEPQPQPIATTIKSQETTQTPSKPLQPDTITIEMSPQNPESLRFQAKKSTFWAVYAIFGVVAMTRANLWLTNLSDIVNQYGGDGDGVGFVVGMVIAFNFVFSPCTGGVLQRRGLPTAMVVCLVLTTLHMVVSVVPDWRAQVLAVPLFMATFPFSFTILYTYGMTVAGRNYGLVVGVGQLIVAVGTFCLSLALTILLRGPLSMNFSALFAILGGLQLLAFIVPWLLVKHKIH
mmetsp:Transcript_44736/g.51461  ORF Transcript_44736/g.51461 Transcript_44736/m.51461 type:complete len:441 (+) Transcript_44736:83-1405(+)